MDIIFEETLAISEDEKNEVLAILPDCFQTRVTRYNRDTRGLYIEIRTNIRDKENALHWKAEFERTSKTTYKADSTYEENTQKTVFKCVYHCQHNTRPKAVTKNPHHKHTKCLAKMIINVKQSAMKRSKDMYLKTLPCQISLRHEHNHSEQFSPVSDSQEKRLLANLLDCDLSHNWFESLCGDETQESASGTSSLGVINLEYSSLTEEIVSPTQNISKRRVKEAENNLREAFDTILQKLREKPDIYVQSINKFSDLVQDVKTDSAMISALDSFGKYSGLPLKKNSQDGKSAQPTAVARKEVSLGGRNVAISGQPFKTHQEHTYVKTKRTKATDLPPAKKSALPHSLLLIVEN